MGSYINIIIPKVNVSPEVIQFLEEENSSIIATLLMLCVTLNLPQNIHITCPSEKA